MTNYRELLRLRSPGLNHSKIAETMGISRQMEGTGRGMSYNPYLKEISMLTDELAVILNHEMFVAGSNYWNMAYGQMPGDVLNDEEGLANMKNLGENMIYLLKALNDK